MDRYGKYERSIFDICFHEKVHGAQGPFSAFYRQDTRFSAGAPAWRAFPEALNYESKHDVQHMRRLA